MNRKIHGRGHKSSSNSNRLVIYLHNPPREGSSKGTNTFKTTYTFKDVKEEEVYSIIEQFTDRNSKINKIIYNNKLI
jgi:hypothetical protein